MQTCAEEPHVITIKDIAREKGGSHTAMSRALHIHPVIPSQTSQRIQIVAAQMGYPSPALPRAQAHYLHGPAPHHPSQAQVSSGC
jgi:hypothetical protein